MAKNILLRTVRWSLTLVCLALIGAGLLLGQMTIGRMTGVVTDPSGAVIPGARITITNQATGVNYNLQTNSAGVYDINSLLSGTYTLTIQAKGFRTYSNRGIVLTTDQTVRLDVALEVGAETQTVTVEAGAPLVNTEEGRLSALVMGSQVQNMPLNGRDIYDLMQLVPGAVNSVAVNIENTNGGSMTNINGNRANFNGFLMDGVANKGLSGGSNAQPAPDFVSEFRIMTNNFSAQYGNSAGSVTDVSIRSGTNQFHGDAWEFFRNDKLNARNFFSDKRDKWRQNQFGATIGGPIKKDKLFFFGGYEGERFRTTSPQQYTVETPAFRQAVQGLFPNSVAALMYSNFPAPMPTAGFSTIDSIVSSQAVNDIGATIGSDYFADGTTNTLVSDAYVAYADPCFLNTFLAIGSPAYPGGPNWGNAQTVANSFGALLGVTPAENSQIAANINAACPGSFTAPAAQGGAISRTANMLGLVNYSVPTRTTGVFFNGDQFTGRIDYQGEKNRIFGRVYHYLQKDPNFTTATSQVRGFFIPHTVSFPGAAFGFVHNFTPSVVNEFRAGYIRNQLSFIPTKSQNGVPTIGFDTADVQFGAYNGYPQFFNENVFNYQDMVGIVKGKHSLKMGAELKRNQENSEFNVGRPSFYFFDQLYFAASLPYDNEAGVNPELLTGAPSHIDTNIREWRNYELSFYGQDDWKVTKNFTLNLGLRWDYYQPHHEKLGKTTRFDFGPGLALVNCQAYLPGKGCIAPAGDTFTPNGGFTKASRLFNPDKNNFSPRIGFAWDPRGDGKTAIRGGFAVFFESTFYNSLSNSRWNLPFYSFNDADPLLGVPGQLVFGPFDSTGNPDPSRTPTFSGPPDNPGQGPAGAGFAGNLYGWWPGNPNLAALTGIPDPSTRSPYVENGFFGFQRELSPTTVLEVNWVGTYGHKLMWAENPNRVVGGKLRDPSTIINPCTGSPVAAPTAHLNPCFGTMRTWKNSVNSNYEALQVSMTKRASHGVTFTSAYTWSHTIDFRSTWHALTSGSSATEADPFGSSGYSMDPNRIYLERGNSLFDVRHRWVTAFEWELPWMKGQQGVAGRVLGGWQMNWNIAFQGGFPFTVGARKDFNKDGLKNDRPNTPTFGNHRIFSNQDYLLGSGPNGQSLFQSLGPSGTASCPTATTSGCLGVFPVPASGTDGNLGRNTFRGPGFANADFSLFKKIPINERFRLQFRAEFFNVTNRVNLYQPEANLAASAFGLSQQAFNPRVIQFGLKLEF